MAQLQSELSAPSRDGHQRALPGLEGLTTIGVTVRAVPGQTIGLEGDPCTHCFRVLTGAVRLYKSTIDGRRQLIDFLAAGDCFGLLGAHCTYGVEAITHTTLIKTSRATLAAAVRQQPALAERLIGLAADELGRAHQHMLLLGRKNAQEKVASLLLELARRTRRRPGKALLPIADFAPGDGRQPRPHHRDRQPHHDASEGGRIHRPSYIS